MLSVGYSDLFCVLQGVGCTHGGDVEHTDSPLWGGPTLEILWWHYGHLFKGMLIKIHVRYCHGCDEKTAMVVMRKTCLSSFKHAKPF